MSFRQGRLGEDGRVDMADDAVLRRALVGLPPGIPAGSGAPMPCGPFGLTCDTAVEICVSRTPVGPAVVYSCDPVPAGCEQDRSCGCAGSTVCAAPFSDCTDVGLNSLQCECAQCQ